MRPLHSCDTASRPLAPRSGEKVAVRQHRMRGRELGCAIAAAVVRKRRFIGCCGRSTKRLIRPAAHLPAGAGRRESNRFRQRAAVHSATAPAFLRPAQRGEGGAAAADEGPWEVGVRSPLQSCANAVSSAVAEEARKRPHPLPAGHLSRWRGAKGKQSLSPACSGSFLRQSQPSFAPRSGEKARCGSTG